MDKLTLKNERAIRRERIRPLMTITAVLIVMVLVFEIIRPGFLSSSAHVVSILKTASMLGLCCIGQTLVILQGGIDISIVSVILMTTCLSAELMNGDNANIPLALGVVILIGMAVGFLNGILIHKLKVPPMVMTLSMGSVVRGIAYLQIKGAPKGSTAPAWSAFVNTTYFGFLNGVTLFFFVLAATTIILLRYTPFGRYVYAIGANREAARYSGVKVGVITVASYMISSVLAAICGMVLCGFTGLPYMSSGSTYDMDSITAVVIGGTLITGGKGGFAGTIAGLLTYICLESFMTMLAMPEGWKRVVQAVVTIAVLLAVSKVRGKSKT